MSDFKPWNLRLPPGMTAGNWRFWNRPMVLKNEKTGELVHVKLLTTSAKLIYEILRLERKPGEGHDIEGFIRLLARIMAERFDMRPVDVLSPYGDSREADWRSGGTRPEGHSGPFRERMEKT